MNRRAFTKASGAFVASALLGRSLQSKPQGQTMTVIDTHQHLWDRSRFTLPWITKGSILDADFGIKEYREATKGLGTIRTVYMEVDVDPGQQWAEAQFVDGLCKDPQSGMEAAVVSGRPAAPDFAAWVEKVKTLPSIRGIRQVLHVPATPKGFCLQESFVQSMRLLGKNQLSFDLCIRDVDLPETNKLVGLCPETQFILDHCGNPDLKKPDLEPWKKEIDQIARHKNLVIKISGFLASAPARDQWKYDDAAKIVNHCLDCFGPDRCIFGGDWPVVLLGSTLATWLETLRKIVAARPKEDQDKLFFRNAEKLYRLKPAQKP